MCKQRILIIVNYPSIWWYFIHTFAFTAINYNVLTCYKYPHIFIICCLSIFILYTIYCTLQIIKEYLLKWILNGTKTTIRLCSSVERYPLSKLTSTSIYWTQYLFILIALADTPISHCSMIEIIKLVFTLNQDTIIIVL